MSCPGLRRAGLRSLQRQLLWSLPALLLLASTGPRDRHSLGDHYRDGASGASGGPSSTTSLSPWESSGSGCRCEWWGWLGAGAGLSIGLQGASAQPSPSPSPPAAAVATQFGEFGGYPEEEVVLDFLNVTLAANNLGAKGPNLSDPPIMQYSNLGTYEGKPISLIVSNQTTYTPHNASKWNGVNEKYGIINVASATQVTLAFSFASIDPDSSVVKPVTLDKVRERVRVRAHTRHRSS
eukprot:scaffold813_cov313-Prasinococcus_capsulatus_cf.AAC.3